MKFDFEILDKGDYPCTVVDWRETKPNDKKEIDIILSLQNDVSMKMFTRMLSGVLLDCKLTEKDGKIDLPSTFKISSDGKTEKFKVTKKKIITPTEDED